MRTVVRGRSRCIREGGSIDEGSRTRECVEEWMKVHQRGDGGIGEEEVSR